MVSEIHVVDSGSTDATLAVARSFGAAVYSHDFVNHAVQFNWALDHISTDCEWVLRVDADERLSAEFRCSNHLAGLGGSQAGGVRESQLVMTVTLDWLAERFPPPKVLKLDIEGAELLALRGGGRLLASARPRLLLEVFDEIADEVGALLRSYDYRLYDADAPPSARAALDRPVFNTLALPDGMRA